MSLTLLLVTELYCLSRVNHKPYDAQLAFTQKINNQAVQVSMAMMKVTSLSLPHYDTVTQKERDFQILIKQIKMDSPISHLLKTASLDFIDNIEEIKSNYATYKNSLLLFPTEVARLQAETNNPKLYQTLQKLEYLTLLFNINPTTQNKKTLLLYANSIHSDKLNALLKHITLITQHPERSNQLYQKILNPSLQQHSNNLLKYYEKGFEESLIKAQQIKLGFYLFLILFIISTIALSVLLTNTLHKLTRSKDILHLMTNNAPVMLWMSNEKGELTFTNQQCQHTVLQENEKGILSEQHYAHIHPEDLTRVKNNYLNPPESGSVVTYEYRIKDINSDKYLLWSESLTTFPTQKEHKPRLIAAITDISQRKHLEEQVNLSATVFQHIPEGVMLADADNTIIQINPAFTLLTGYSSEEIIGKTPSILNSGKQAKEFYENLWDSLNTNNYWEGEIYNRRKSNEIYLEHLKIIVIKNAQEKITHYMAIFNDLSEQREAEKHINFLAHYDPLTKLANRTLFSGQLQHAIDKSQRNNSGLSLLFIDLDYFKKVNDTLGHKAGDQLLIQVANDIKNCLRKSDHAARIGGDEFVVLLEDIPTEDISSNTAIVAEKIIHFLSQKYTLGDNTAHIGASIGIANYPADIPSHTDDIASSLLQSADMAMYHAKAEGKNNFQFYSKELNKKARHKARLEKDLTVAIQQKQLYLHYQPQYNLITQSIESFEALLRWEHPELGFISPDEFISIAEESDLIIEIGLWVLESAVEQLLIWQKTITPNLFMAVNISVKQLEDNQLIDCLTDLLNKTQIPAPYIELEITENISIDEHSNTLSSLHKLYDLGVQLSMDDFGTGYSNMSYLKKLPINRIKIDRCFITGIPQDNSDQAITQAIISIARHFNFNVIAEGIETKEQEEFLLSQGCFSGQGFLFSRPISAEKATQLLLEKYGPLNP